MTSVAALIQAVHEAGGRLHPIGSDRLKVRAPRPLADDLISELRAHKPAVLSFLASQRTPAPPAAPAAWVAGVARLIGMDPPTGFNKERWRLIVRDAEGFIDTWAGQAAALGWTDQEAYGAHRTAPAVRYDAMGLVAALNGNRIVAMTADDAVIENGRGGRLRHYRRLTAPLSEVVLIWELGR